MSLGWLTESALMPRKAQAISVDSASLLPFQSALSEEVQKHTPHPKAPTTKSLKQLLSRKPETVETAPSEQQEPVLANKAALYDQLRRKADHSDKYLVDFDYQSSSDSEPELTKRPTLANLLTSTEKQYFSCSILPQVISETKEERTLTLQVRRRREQLKQERLQRIAQLKESGRIKSIL